MLDDEDAFQALLRSDGHVNAAGQPVIVLCGFPTSSFPIQTPELPVFLIDAALSVSVMGGYCLAMICLWPVGNVLPVGYHQLPRRERDFNFLAPISIAPSLPGYSQAPSLQESRVPGCAALIFVRLFLCVIDHVRGHGVIEACIFSWNFARSYTVVR